MVDTTFPLAGRPRLRPIEVIPVQEAGRRVFWLRDPADPELQPLGVSDGAVQVLTLLDGQRTVGELAAALSLRGGTISQTQLKSFLVRLDEAGYLEGPRATHRFEQRRDTFLALPLRPAVHAGGAYAGTAERKSTRLNSSHIPLSRM